MHSNRAAAFLHLVKLSKALADAEMTINLKPEWEKGYFRKGCILEAMERYEDALAAFQIASKYNPQSSEVSKKIKILTQLAKDKKRTEELENMRSNVDMAKHFDALKSELSEKYGAEDSWKEFFSFHVETVENAVKSWHETSKVDPRVYFLLNKEKTDTEKYAPAVNIDKAFESPHTHSNCFSFLRQYAEDSFAQAACLVTPKVSYLIHRLLTNYDGFEPGRQPLRLASGKAVYITSLGVWKGQGSRKWKHGQNDGIFVQFESPLVRRLWFIPSSTEKGKTLCRDPMPLDISAHEILPRVFKQE
ncbi:hypothetical protein H5410_048316 [Solanum commersonii]|uniref:Uncharacterized protein n=1 Tax=Solanum commersonii TaxID=4109 RepID=A0A9J5XJI4_SOLCO|nr:hypothetical protein H5410_048316 [Solanum commersonii]